MTSGIFSATENFFFIRNLKPQTAYELEVTARNQAGTTQAQYEFYTKTLGKKEGGEREKRNNHNTVDRAFDLLSVVSSLSLLTHNSGR